MDLLKVLLGVLVVFSGAASLHASRLCLKGDFDVQVEQLLQNVLLPKEELDKLPRLVQDLEQTLQTHWPGCKVIPFGSAVMGLALTTSDFDCHVTLPNRTYTAQSDMVIKAKDALQKRPDLFRNLVVITTAKVPIARFIHLPSNRSCDINFQEGKKNSVLVSAFLDMDIRHLKLALIVKYWSKVHKVTGKRFGNYCVSLLVIFYLQQQNILPPVALLQKNAKTVFVKEWNTGFDKITFNSTNNDSLYELLGGFFKYYSNFDFDENVVSIYAGRPIKRSVFKDLNKVPDDFVVYKRNLRNRAADPLVVNKTLCVQHPFIHNENVASSTNRTVGNRLKLHLLIAAEVYESSSSDTFLATLLTRNEDLTSPPIKKYTLLSDSASDKIDSCRAINTL